MVQIKSRCHGSNPASIGLTFVQKFAYDHLNVVDRTSGDFLFWNVYDLGVIADGTLDLDCLDFISHTPLPKKYAIYHRLFFGVNERKE